MHCGNTNATAFGEHGWKSNASEKRDRGSSQRKDFKGLLLDNAVLNTGHG